MIKINKELVDGVSKKAVQATRKRMNHNFHQEAGDLLQRMLNALEPGTYIRPHKHEDPDKREAFVILKGRVAFVEFDKEGNITDYTIMDRNDEVYGVEISPRTFHTLVALEPGSVLYEIKDGPYDPYTDKDFAPWAPEEGSDKATDYVKWVTERVK